MREALAGGQAYGRSGLILGPPIHASVDRVTNAVLHGCGCGLVVVQISDVVLTCYMLA